jgi:hypothetical protein
VVNKSAEAKKTLDDFFAHLNELGKWYIHYTSEVPKKIFVNPEIIARMARVEGFYQRPELQGMVTASAPVIRWLKMDFGMVLIVDDWEEKFLHYED